MSVLGTTVTFADHSAQEVNGSKYTFNWSSVKQDANKKKDRTKVPLLFQFQDGVQLVLPLQVIYLFYAILFHVARVQSLTNAVRSYGSTAARFQFG